ncbi:MAG: inositol monophosphatase [Acidobacteriota bacterium]
MKSGLLSCAMTAAELGGDVVRRYFRRLSGGQVDEKAANDWVTAADRESEEAIFQFLARETPGVGFLAEERGGTVDGGLQWVVDPLDGTLNFVRGFPHFAVSVALVNGGSVEVGVIFDPVRDEMYTAQRGRGAACNGDPLRVSGREALAGAFVTTGFPFRIHRHLDAFLAVFREVFPVAGGLRRPGAAALDLAHVGAGIFDAFFEFGLAAWDVAAGALIVREAGGVVSNLDGGEDVLARGNIVAATPSVHRQLLSLIQRHCCEATLAP